LGDYSFGSFLDYEIPEDNSFIGGTISSLLSKQSAMAIFFYVGVICLATTFLVLRTGLLSLLLDYWIGAPVFF